MEQIIEFFEYAEYEDFFANIETASKARHIYEDISVVHYWLSEQRSSLYSDQIYCFWAVLCTSLWLVLFIEITAYFFLQIT